MTHYIYKISNDINSKIYVGQTTNPRARWCKHQLESKNLILKRDLYLDINKYGIEHFCFDVIDETTYKTEANELERLYIKFYNSLKKGYNNETGGISGYKVSDETRAKMSQSHKGLKNAKGHKVSAETRAKISKANKGNKYTKGNLFVKGRIWINNGTKNKFIYPSEFEEFSKQGYVKGMIFYNK